MLLRLRQLTGHVLMLQFVMRDLLEREDIERIKKVVNDQAAESSSRRGQTILAVRKQLDKLAVDQKKRSLATAAAKAAARAGGQAKTDEDIERLVEEESGDVVGDGEVVTEPTQQEISGHGSAGGQFGREYNFKPYLNSLKTGESWEKVKKNAKCAYCHGRPKEPYMTSCGHLICSDPCLTSADLEAAEEGKEHAACRACGVTPIYIHQCDPEEDDYLEPVAQGTRAQAKTKKAKERNRVRHEDIKEDWLASIGDEVLPSAKTIAVKAQIINWTKENPGVKIIIYSQFLAM